MANTRSHLIEAKSNRIDEINIKDGNIIINLDDEKVLFDDIEGNRIEFSSIVMKDKESDFLKTTGIIGKVYIGKDTGSMYYYGGTKWYPITVSSYNMNPTDFYVSSDGSDDNDGLSSEKPSKSIAAVLKKYANNAVMRITLLTSTEDEIVSIQNKRFLSITGSSEKINFDLTVSNSHFELKNIITSSTIAIQNSSGTFTNITTDNSIYVFNSSIYMANLNLTSTNDESLDIRRNSMVTLDNSNVARSYISIGSILNIGKNNTAENITVDKSSKINSLDLPTDRNTYEYINEKLQDAGTRMMLKLFTILPEEWTPCEYGEDIKYYTDIPVEGINYRYFATVYFDEMVKSICAEAKVKTHGNTIKNAVRVYSVNIPSDGITGHIIYYRLK